LAAWFVLGTTPAERVPWWAAQWLAVARQAEDIVMHTDYDRTCICRSSALS
jgi:hypothetical protein